ncbi:MAG: OsmC family protein [Candidatus Bathyarchaeia archaeon]|jgi:uncharacterized OsmC-like protein
MSEECIDKVCSLVKECKGVCSIVKVLDEEERKKLLELETAEEGNLIQFGASIQNQGMKEVLSRDVVLLVVNDNNFEYKDPTIILKAGEEVVGEEIFDPAKLNEMKGKPGYLITGKGFVIYTHKFRGKKGLKVQFITLPFSFPYEGLKKGSAEVKGATDFICGWPSRSVDLYLKKAHNIETQDLKLGTLLFGFNRKTPVHDKGGKNLSDTIRSSVPSDLKYLTEVDWDKKTGGNARFGDSVQGLKYALSLDKPTEFGGKGDLPSPCSIFFTGLGGCILTTFLYAKERMRFEISDLKVTIEADVSSSMVGGYHLEQVTAVIHVTTNSETNKEKAIRCGNFVKSYSFALRALQAGTKINLETEVTIPP